MEILKHFHSGFRWIVLIALIIAIVNNFIKMRKGAPYGEKDRKRNLIAMITSHIQLLAGLGLYFWSPKVQFTAEAFKVAWMRFYTLEHPSIMIIALVLITLGYTLSKTQETSQKKFKVAFWLYLIGLLVMLAGIPWPFQTELGAGWG